MSAKLKYLLKKNLTFVYRNWLWTITEQLLVAIIFITIILYPKPQIKSYRLDVNTANQTQSFEKLTNIYDMTAFKKFIYVNQNRIHSFAYTPANKHTRNIMQSVARHFDVEHFWAAESEQVIVHYFLKSFVLCGIIFHNFESGKIPNKLSVTLRFPSHFRTIQTNNVKESLWITRCSGVMIPEETDSLDNLDLYLREGFLQLQHRIFMEWLRVYKKIEFIGNPLREKVYDFIPKISVSSIRHLTDHEPCYATDTSNFIWFLYNFPFFVPFLRLIKRYAREYEENIYEHQWIYGYKRIHHRMAHFIISFSRLLILDLIITLIVSTNWTSHPKVAFRDINTANLFTFLLLYTAMLIIYAMIVATLFMDATNCMLFGAVLWLGNYGLFSTVLEGSESINGSVIFSFIFFFNNYFPFGMRLFENFAKNSDNRQIKILFRTQLATIFILVFVLSLVGYLRPGRYTKTDSRTIRKTIYTIDRPAPSWHHYEYVPINGVELLYIKNIVTYLDRLHIKQQLKNVTMRFFRNEISVILGAHSTGKTRLISILAGWRKPPAGYIYYNGDVDIFSNWKFYRRFVDVCMPNNALFDLLSVHQTLEYFCKVKIERYDKKKVQREVNKYLNLIKPHISDCSILIKDLSFCQKRIVALCCTLLCDRPVILLDEPTLHMTAPEQRFYWQILHQEKANRAIIVTTFSVDEADAIGDRIGILNDGFLVAYGSSFFLRSRFGYGFDLIIIKDPKKSTKPINKIIKKYLVDFRPEHKIGDQVIYKLPSGKLISFQRMLMELEKESTNLGITNIRMSGSDLSEIYVTLGTEPPLKQALPKVEAQLKLTNDSNILLKHQQIQAMLYKKMIHQAPNVIPIIMIFVVFLLILLINKMTERMPVGRSLNASIELGYRQNETSRKLLTRYKNCKYVEVNEIEYVMTNSSMNRYFIFKKLFCGKEKYNQSTRHDVDIYEKLGAVEKVSKKQMTIWINQKIFHTAAIALNLAHNLILQDLYPNKPDMITTIRNMPVNVPLHTKIDILENKVANLRVPLTMGIVMPITMSCFIISLVEERYNHLFILQRLAGIRMNVYWIVGILWDFGTFFSFSLIYMLTMALTTIEDLGMKAKLFIFLLINVHGLTALTMIYLISLFMGVSKCRAFLIALVIQFTFANIQFTFQEEFTHFGEHFWRNLIWFFAGLCAYIFYWEVLENDTFYFYILSLSPTFTFLDAISRLYTASKDQEYCLQRGLLPGSTTSCYFDTFLKLAPPGLLPSLFFMIASTILFGLLFFLVNLYRKEIRYSLVKKIKQMRTVWYPSDDPDVVKEKTLIASLSMASCKRYNVLVDQIEEKIPERSKRLNTVSFALDKNMSMGIYGSRHCGKSHLIHQLVGDHGYRFGEMYICHKDCKNQMDKAYKHVGFCPQDRGLCDAFTPRQLFTLLFMIRGFPATMINEKLREISRSLILRRNMCKMIGILPIAVKRKVNIAIALIVYNKVLILDEPTRGMPPMESRIIWNVLRYARYSGNTIIFSSNDSLECESLADYMIVVDKGEMLAMGSYHYLKEKYTTGFYLEVKLLADGTTATEAEDNLLRDIENMNRYAYFLHGDSVLIYRSYYNLKYYIPVEKITYSYLFGSLEKNRNSLNISEYTIGQISLLTALENIHTARLRRVPYKQPTRFQDRDKKQRYTDDRDRKQRSPDEYQQSPLIFGDDTEDHEEEENRDNRRRRRSILYRYGVDVDDGEVPNNEILSQQLQQSEPNYKFQLQAEVHSPLDGDSDEIQA